MKVKKLYRLNPKHSGRNNSGKITVRHQGGRQKRYLRTIDWKRNQKDIPAKVASIEYDPNRTADIALLFYANGLKNYILAPKELKVGHTVISSEVTDIKPGNCCHIANVPVGTPIHNLEIVPGKGAQMVRTAGNHAQVQSKEEDVILVKLSSGEIRKIDWKNFASLGQNSNPDWNLTVIGKAGRSRHLGIRPTVRGSAMNPCDHPHGGGEAKAGQGNPHPVSPWGTPAKGYKTRKNKRTQKFIVRDRRG